MLWLWGQGARPKLFECFDLFLTFFSKSKGLPHKVSTNKLETPVPGWSLSGVHWFIKLRITFSYRHWLQYNPTGKSRGAVALLSSCLIGREPMQLFSLKSLLLNFQCSWLFVELFLCATNRLMCGRHFLLVRMHAAIADVALASWYPRQQNKCGV